MLAMTSPDNLESPANTPTTQDWMRSVSTVGELACVKDQNAAVRVAQTPLNLPSGSYGQLWQLELLRDYGHKSDFARKFRNARSRSINSLMSSVAFCVSGWHLDSAHSTLARQRFKKLAAPLLPIAKGQSELLEGLSLTFAQLAGTMDRRHLSFLFRAQGTSLGDPEMHCDPDSDYVGIAYIFGNTSPHAAPASYTQSELVTDYTKQGNSMTSLPLTDAIAQMPSAPTEEATHYGVAITRLIPHRICGKPIPSHFGCSF
jgi:hypothetical protein